MAESLEKRIRTKNDYELLREASTDSLPNKHTMDEPEKKRRRTEVDDGTSKEDVIVAIEHVKESFLNDLDDDCIDGIISYLKNEKSSEDVFVFSQVNRRIYYRVAAHMKRKCNRLPIKRMDWADMDKTKADTLIITVSKNHRYYQTFDEIKQLFKCDWITEADSRSLEIEINRIDDYGKSMICGVIGKTINEVSYCPGEIHLPEISEMIGDASVNKLHVKSFFDIIEIRKILHFYEKRKGMLVKFYDTPTVSKFSTSLKCEEGTQGLQDLFNKVDLYFESIDFNITTSNPYYLFTNDTFKTFCENIYSKCGIIILDSRVIKPPFNFNNLHEISKIGFYSQGRNFL